MSALSRAARSAGRREGGVLVEFDEMLSTVRKNLVASFRTRVRRSRRFEVYLVNPSQLPDRVDPKRFERIHNEVLRPLLDDVSECRLFLPEPPDGAADGGQEARTSGAGSRYEQYLQWRAARDSTEDSYVGRLRECWDHAGASPRVWLDQYGRAADGSLSVELTPAVLANALFWWWVCCGRSGIRLAFALSPLQVEEPEFFARVIDPFTLGGSFERNARVALTWARRETARSAIVALIVHPDGLYASVVARSSGIEGLFERAVNTAVITQRLWARP